MTALQELGQFKVSIGGIVFTGRRRTTALMLQIGDTRRTFGLLQSGLDKERTPEQQAIDMQKYTDETIKMESVVCEIALLEIDGVPWIHGGLEWPELDPIAGPFLKAFMASGLAVDPTSDSCKAPAESN